MTTQAAHPGGWSKHKVLATDGQEEAGVRTCLGARRALSKQSKTSFEKPPTQSGKLWEEDQQGLTTKGYLTRQGFKPWLFGIRTAIQKKMAKDTKTI